MIKIIKQERPVMTVTHCHCKTKFRTDEYHEHDNWSFNSGLFHSTTHRWQDLTTICPVCGHWIYSDRDAIFIDQNGNQITTLNERYERD